MSERMRFFSLSFCILVIIIIFPVLLSAGQVEKERHNYLKPGSWSVQFQIADEINLRPFNSKAISLKHHLSEKSAVRMGLNLDLDSESYEDVTKSSKQDSLLNNNLYEQESNSEMIQLTIAGYLAFPHFSVLLPLILR